MKKLFLILPLMLVLGGCPDPYGSCAKASDDIGSSIAQGNKTLVQLQQGGEITAAEQLNVAGYLEFANKGNEAFQTCIAAAHAGGNKPGTYTACAQTFNATLNTPSELALIKVSNTQAAATISTIVDTLTTGVTVIQSKLGGA